MYFFFSNISFKDLKNASENWKSITFFKQNIVLQAKQQIISEVLFNHRLKGKYIENVTLRWQKIVKFKLR